MATKKQCCEQYDGQTTTIKMENCVHSGKIVCKHCQKFIKWAKKDPNEVFKQKQCCDEYDGKCLTIIMREGKHYAKKVCEKCHSFLAWLPNPNITKEVDERDKKIEELITSGHKFITPKRIAFLEGIKGVRFITPRQLLVYNNIISKCV